MLFAKMNGLGNDYIFIDSSNIKISQLDYINKNIKILATKLSNRHFGIGGDGVVLLEPSKIADVKMRIFNADGSEGKMCGNALRCVGSILFKRSNNSRYEFVVETLSGIKGLNIIEAHGNEVIVSTDLGEVKYNTIIDEIEFIDVGNPHAVFYVDALDDNAIKKAKEISNEYDVNAEAVLLRNDCLEMRVWERGSGETLACGTGAAAIAFSAFEKKLFNNFVNIKLKGGMLKAIRSGKNISIIGNASLNYIGEVNLEYYG